MSEHEPTQPEQLNIEELERLVDDFIGLNDFDSERAHGAARFIAQQLQTGGRSALWEMYWTGNAIAGGIVAELGTIEEHRHMSEAAKRWATWLQSYLLYRTVNEQEEPLDNWGQYWPGRR